MTSPGGPWEITIQGRRSVTCNDLHEIRFLAESCPKKVAKTLDHKGPGNSIHRRSCGKQADISNKPRLLAPFYDGTYIPGLYSRA